jgi:hypothetical protein
MRVGRKDSNPSSYLVSATKQKSADAKLDVSSSAYNVIPNRAPNVGFQQVVAKPTIRKLPDEHKQPLSTAESAQIPMVLKI